MQTGLHRALVHSDSVWPLGVIVHRASVSSDHEENAIKGCPLSHRFAKTHWPQGLQAVVCSGLAVDC